MIIALSGRRVDAPGAKQPRFPSTPEHVETVRGRILDLLKNQNARVLVSSAACGADLLALSAAGSLGLRRRIVLPFDPETFRKTSVTDRPGNWVALYDSVVDEAMKNGDLVVTGARFGSQAYSETNHSILDEALLLARSLHYPVAAVLVWDRESRGEGDLTEEFGVYARSKKVPVIEITTL